jgi:hypothetical protein
MSRPPVRGLVPQVIPDPFLAVTVTARRVGLSAPPTETLGFGCFRPALRTLPGFSGSPKFFQALTAKLHLVCKFGKRRGIEEPLHLLGECLVPGPVQHGLATLPKRVTGQGDLERLPGLVAGGPESIDKSQAVIREAIGEEVDHGVGGLVAGLKPYGTTGPANQLS